MTISNTFSKKNLLPENIAQLQGLTTINPYLKKLTQKLQENKIPPRTSYKLLMLNNGLASSHLERILLVMIFL